MVNPSRVETYFSRVAHSYQSASKGGLWRIVRERESAALLGILGAVRGHEVLELGCGSGYYTRQLLAQGARHVCAVDLSREMLDLLPQDNVTPLCGDAASIDPGRRFDLMLSAGMLEFVPDPAAVLANAARLAGERARLAVLYPTHSLLGQGYRYFHKRNGLEITLFDVPALTVIAAAAGWVVAEARPAGPYSGVALLARGVR